MEGFFTALKEQEDLTDEQVGRAKSVFAEQEIGFKQLMKTGNLAITDEKLEKIGVKQLGLQTAILSVIQSQQQ